MKSVFIASFITFPVVCVILTFIAKIFMPESVSISIISDYFFYSIVSLIQFFPLLSLSHILAKSLNIKNGILPFLPLIASVFFPNIIGSVLAGAHTNADVFSASPTFKYYLTLNIACLLAILYYSSSLKNIALEKEENKAETKEE